MTRPTFELPRWRCLTCQGTVVSHAAPLDHYRPRLDNRSSLVCPGPFERLPNARAI